MRRKRFTVAVWLVLIASLCIMGYSWRRLSETERVYAEGDRSYEALAGQVCQRASSTSQTRTNAARASADARVDDTMAPEVSRPSKSPQVEIPDMAIDFEALRAVNPDATAWLYCPDTAIDYPVMRADNYDRYLHHLPDGSYNRNGSLFLDYNNPSDFSGRLNIIYGHNMKSGRMFGSLTNYKRRAYFEKHPYMFLYTADRGNFRIELLYGCVVGAGEWRDRAFMFEVNLPSLLQFAETGTIFRSGVSCVESDRFVVLSTCSYEFNDARYVVIGMLVPEYAK